jgi:hypothetical protein
MTNLCQKEFSTHGACTQLAFGDSQFRGTPTTKDIFLTSKLWQYGVTANDSRKYRLIETRMKRLAKVLARFDRSGACREIYPAVSTILAKLKERELNYPEPQRLTWSRRTVFLYMERLEEAEIMKRGKLSRYHGTRRRVLDPAGLLSVPRECCTPTRRESCTRNKSLRSKKNHEASPVRKPNIEREKKSHTKSQEQRLRCMSDELTTPEMPMYGPMAQTWQEAVTRALEVKIWQGVYPPMAVDQFKVRARKGVSAEVHWRNDCLGIAGPLESLPKKMTSVSYWTTDKYSHRDPMHSIEEHQLDHATHNLRTYAERHCSEELAAEIWDFFYKLHRDAEDWLSKSA